MKQKISLASFFLILALLLSCKDSLDINKALQKVIVVNNVLTKDTTKFNAEIKNNYDFWNTLSHKMDDSYIEKKLTFLSSKDKKIVINSLGREIYEINAINSNYINYKIYPSENNYLSKSEWDIHCLVYVKDSNMVQKKYLVAKLADNWYHLKFKGKRYIGG
jgi:hypothetical protein